MAAGWTKWTGRSQYPEIRHQQDNDYAQQNGMANHHPAEAANYGPKQDRQFRIGWIQGKRDPNHEYELMQWVARNANEQVQANADFVDYLKDGVVLCKLMQNLEPGSCPRINTRATAFGGATDNVNNFLNAAIDYGLCGDDLFELTDLTERRNIPRVVATIDALAALAEAGGRQQQRGGRSNGK